MKLGNFLFPASADPNDDARIIEETLQEAKLCDALGMQMLWLAEHHFDGICAYVDPIAFAAALATATEQIGIGFAVAQTSLHHPIRLAEQLALIDNLSRGRLCVGLGRGTAYNIYDYQGYGIDPDEAQERLLEAEALMIAAWTEENMVHEGKFWSLRLPRLRPRPFTQPHPYLIRACSGEQSMLQMAREGRPFLMNVQSNEVTRQRLCRYRETMLECGFNDEMVAQNLSETWVWRNVFVADTDAQAERLVVPWFEQQTAFRQAMRKRIYEEQGIRLKAETSTPARAQASHAVVYGSPSTVAQALEEISATGAGGLIAQFRIGPMPFEVAEQSIQLFMQEVIPQLSASR